MIDPYSTDVLWIVIVGFIMAFILACGIGANSVPNSFATCIGSKALTVRQACYLGTVFEIAGSVLLGYNVSDTVRKYILQLNVYEGEELELLLGMFAALIGSSILLLGATFLKLPVSATHSVVGAVLGFSLVCHGSKSIGWRTLGMIVGSWFVSPVMSGAISVLLFVLIRRFIINAPNPKVQGLLSLPIFYSATIFINVFSVILDGPSLLCFDRIPWWGALLISLGIGTLAALIVQFYLVPFMKRKIDEVGSMQKTPGGVVKKPDIVSTETNELGKDTITRTNADTEGPVLTADEITNDLETLDSNKQPKLLEDGTTHGQDNPVFRLSPDNSTELPVSGNDEDSKDNKEVTGEDTPEVSKLFSFLQILAATFASFARGGNDVSNATGPVIAIWLIYSEGSVQQKAETPIYILFYGGVGISVGLWVCGQRVMKTIGEDLTKIAASTGFTIEIGAALTVLLASKIGIPISTTHCKVGSIVFVGWLNSTKQGVDWKLFRQVLLNFLSFISIVKASFMDSKFILHT